MITAEAEAQNPGKMDRKMRKYQRKLVLFREGRTCRVTAYLIDKFSKNIEQVFYNAAAVAYSSDTLPKLRTATNS